MSVINALIETQEFATLPPVAARILKLLEDDNIDIRDLSKIIEADAPLTLKLLRVANSPLYATHTEINSIQQAIITLGLNRLTNIVLGVSIFSRFLISSQKQAAELMEKFWWHSSCTGIVAKSLANKIKKQFREVEFIGGLLHDIGKLVMLQFDSKRYFEIVEIIEKEKISDLEAEMKVFGVTHLDVGQKISELWKLPHELCTIISNHHSPSSLNSNRAVVSVVRTADLLCEIWGAGFFEGIESIEFAKQESWLLLCNEFPELNQLDVEVFTFELEKDFKNSSEFLNMIISEK